MPAMFLDGWGIYQTSQFHKNMADVVYPSFTVHGRRRLPSFTAPAVPALIARSAMATMRQRSTPPSTTAAPKSDASRRSTLNPPVLQMSGGRL